MLTEIEILQKRLVIAKARKDTMDANYILSDDRNIKLIESIQDAIAATQLPAEE